MLSDTCNVFDNRHEVKHEALSELILTMASLTKADDAFGVLLKAIRAVEERDGPQATLTSVLALIVPDILSHPT